MSDKPRANNPSSLKSMLGCGGSVAIGLFMLSVINRPDRSFEYKINRTLASEPWVRIISKRMSADIDSPFSWFYPTATHVVFAQPAESFSPGETWFQVTSIEKNENPWTYMSHVDCKKRQRDRADLYQSSSAEAVRNVFGAPIISSDGRTWRYFHSSYDDPRTELMAFCDQSWEKESSALHQMSISGVEK